MSTVQIDNEIKRELRAAIDGLEHYNAKIETERDFEGKSFRQRDEHYAWSRSWGDELNQSSPHDLGKVTRGMRAGRACLVQLKIIRDRAAQIGDAGDGVQAALAELLQERVFMLREPSEEQQRRFDLHPARHPADSISIVCPYRPIPATLIATLRSELERLSLGNDIPDDLISMKVALSEFDVSRSTLKSQIKHGPLTSYRPSNCASNREHLLSRSEVASLFTARQPVISKLPSA